jgi:hypothetical protein
LTVALLVNPAAETMQLMILQDNPSTALVSAMVDLSCDERHPMM